MSAPFLRPATTVPKHPPRLFVYKEKAHATAPPHLAQPPTHFNHNELAFPPARPPIPRAITVLTCSDRTSIRGASTAHNWSLGWRPGPGISVARRPRAGRAACPDQAEFIRQRGETPPEGHRRNPRQLAKPGVRFPARGHWTIPPGPPGNTSASGREKIRTPRSSSAAGVPFPTCGAPDHRRYIISKAGNGTFPARGGSNDTPRLGLCGVISTLRPRGLRLPG